MEGFDELKFLRRVSFVKDGRNGGCGGGNGCGGCGGGNGCGHLLKLLQVLELR